MKNSYITPTNCQPGLFEKYLFNTLYRACFLGIEDYHIHCIDSKQKSKLPAVDWQRKGGEYMKKISNRNPKNFKQYQQTPDGKIKNQFESENKKCDKFWRKK